MKVNERWLREWIDPPKTTHEIADQLTMAGLEVDSVTPLAREFSGVVIGLVESVTPHPNAERLRCCKVNVGQKELLDIVCGATNVRPNLHVPVAMVGATLPGNIQIKPVTLRGETSHGMICSAKELGIATIFEPHKGIMELPADAPIGKDFGDYWQLPDNILDIELTPNRGDCLCLKGIAREVALINAQSLNEVEISSVPPSTQSLFPVRVSAPSACPRYVGRVIEQVNSKALTPVWMQERLTRCGVRCIHPVVDVCNYVMLELGQPMHAFDLNTLEKEIQVRYAKSGEKIVLIDGSEITLQEKTLVIADSSKPQAIAGIMGGSDSAVSESTINIFLESAYFDSVEIRSGVARYGIQSDSAYRYERGVDYQLQTVAIERATALLLAIVGGKAGPIIERVEESKLPQPAQIILRKHRIKQVLGMTFEDAEIEGILVGLGMHVNSIAEGWECTAPGYRFDLAIEDDLIEELARVNGYEKIPTQRLCSELIAQPIPESQLERSRIIQTLVDRGYHEVISYSFVDEKLQRLLNPGDSPITLSNPITNDMSVMRTNLWSGLMSILLYNLNRQVSRLRIFETGLSFQESQSGDWVQTPRLAILTVGDAHPEHWGIAKRAMDFFDLKGDIETLLELTDRSHEFRWLKGSHPVLHPGRSADLYHNETKIGYIGELHPQITQQLDLPQSPLLFEADLKALQSRRVPEFKGLSKFPSVRRDLALVVDEKLNAEDIRQKIIQVASTLLIHISIFDLYQGAGIEPGKKSLAMGLTFQDTSRTLIDEEINTIIQKVVELLERDFNATLRV